MSSKVFLKVLGLYLKTWFLAANEIIRNSWAELENFWLGVSPKP